MFFEIAGMIILVFALALLTGLACASIWVAINNEIKGIDSVIKIVFQYFLSAIMMVMVTYVLDAAEAANWAIIGLYAIHILVVAYLMTLRIKSNTLKQLLVVIGVVAYSIALFINQYTIVLPAAIIGLLIISALMTIINYVQKIKNKEMAKLDSI